MAENETQTDIHPLAYVASGAEIGPGCSIGPFAVIAPKVKLGPGNWVGANAVIEGETVAGKNNRFHAHCCVGIAPQHDGWTGATPRLFIGDDNEFREFVTVSGGAFGEASATVIGDRNMLMAYVHIAHDCVLASDIHMANATTLGGHVRIDEHAWVSGLCAVHQGVRIGTRAFVAGGSMVAQDVPPFCLVQGDRAKLVSLNEVGLRRGGLTAGEVAMLRRAFRMLFMGKGVLRERIALARSEFGDVERVVHLIDYLEASERGVISTTRKAA